jgi:hypothetical protein
VIEAELRRERDDAFVVRTDSVGPAFRNDA